MSLSLSSPLGKSSACGALGSPQPCLQQDLRGRLCCGAMNCLTEALRSFASSTTGPALSPRRRVEVPPRRAICCRQRCRWPRVPPALSRKPGLSLLRPPALWDYWALASGAQIAKQEFVRPLLFNLIFVLLGRRQSFAENKNRGGLGGWHEVCAQAGGVSSYLKSAVGAGCGPGSSFPPEYLRAGLPTRESLPEHHREVCLPNHRDLVPWSSLGGRRDAFRG